MTSVGKYCRTRQPVSRSRAAGRCGKLLSVGLLLVAAACASDGSSQAVQQSSLVARAHETADAAQTPTERKHARQAVQKALQALADEPDSVSAQWLRQDLLFRLGQLHLDDGHLVPALSAADMGLSLGRTTTVATANLLVLKGKVLEARGHSQRASDAYHEALLINEALFSTALGETEDAGAVHP